MDSASEELYFQKIEELVQDDDKIVTVSSLAADLGISLQNSRKLISKYVEDQRKLKPDDLAATYVLSGNLKDDGKMGVFMAKEDDIEEKRKLFQSKPNEVIYSVQKTKNVDFNIIALVDMFGASNIRETALYGSIVSKNCTKRILKFKKLPSPPPPTIKGKSSFFIPKPETSTSSEKPIVSPKAEQKSKSASGGIANLFKAAASKPKNGNGTAPAKPNKPATKAGGLAGFLTNGSSKSPKNKNQTNIESNGSKGSKVKNDSSDSKSESQDSIKQEEITNIMDVDFEEDIPETKAEKVILKKGTVAKNLEKKDNSQEKQKGNKRRRDKSKEFPSKKRKRIIERNDSDSDDIFEKEDDDIVDGSDEEPQRIPSPVQKPMVPKNKRKKAVTKAYEDEEGFIVTKTEYIYETASEDENVEPEPPKQEKKEEKSISKPKVAEKKKPAKNQATLMNFFKKV